MINPLKLANEWRDSLLLTTAIAAAASGLIVEAASGVLTVIFWRETLREEAWRWQPPEAIHGAELPPESMQVMCACGFLATLVLAVNLAVQGKFWWLAPVAAVFLPMRGFVILVRHGSFRGAVETYLRVWDWPRKRNGGGGETAKLSGRAVAPAGGAA